MAKVELAILAALLLGGTSQAQPLACGALVKALQGGGYVLVMRHASSPTARPTAAEADPGNPAHERQLDAAGKASASAMGQAIKALRLPIGEVWSSPTYRALQTVRLAGLPTPRTAPELGDGGQSMQAAGAAQGAWLRAHAGAPPKAGTDTVIVTHSPNISAAFGQAAAGLGDGEAMVFHPGGQGAGEPVARIRIEDWPKLAAR
jgi:phosphohistidine phosphatase SixA